jgi:hypothetical protein
MPPFSEARIEELCARIRDICSRPLSPENEAELRKLARELRIAIHHHVRQAKSSLAAKGSAIVARDPDEK